MERRVLLVGWDAADWKIINPLIDRGLMPHTARLVDNGCMANLATLSPPFSPMLWTSIATGKRPYKHGILGFSEPTPDRTSVRPITNLSRKTKAIWNILNQNGKRCNVVGWWPSHPAEPINGVMVSNHYYELVGPREQGWPLEAGAVHPQRLVKTLEELRVHPDDIGPEDILPFIPEGPTINQEEDQRVATCVKMLCECTSIQSAATHLIEHEPWDFMAVYFDAIDHFSHAFMKYHPPRRDWIAEDDFRRYQHVVTTAYIYHDMMLGRLIELAGEGTTVILMSDHGFHPDHLRPAELPSEPAGPAAEHREFGIFAISGPGIRRDELIHGATLLDITPTILTLFGLPTGEDMDGRPLLEAWESRPDATSIASWDEVQGVDGRHPPGTDLPSGDNRAALDQLAALGYIDRVSDDAAEAVRKTQQELDYNLALSYMDGGLHGEAATILAKLYQANPLQFRFGVQLAQCLRALEMIPALEQVVDDIERRWKVAAEVARERLNDISEKLQERFPDENESVGQGDDDKTLADTTPSTSKNVRADRDKLSEVEIRVIRDLQSVARGNPRTLDFLRSCIAMAKGDPVNSAALLEKASESKSMLPGYHIQLGDAYLKLKRPKDAERSFRRALEIDPDRAHAHLGLCRSFLQRRQPQKALESATQAVAQKFHFPVAHYFLGISRLRLQDPDGAVQAAKQALEQNPNFPEAHSLLARVYRCWLQQPDLELVHTRMAQQIRAENRRRRERRILPEMPPIDAESMTRDLPKFPDPANSKFLTSLAEPPLDEAAASCDSAASERSGEQDVITVVSGLPRSGTSMMMQMLVAGGLEPLIDCVRVADQSNPKGYFEYEKIKRLAQENNWLPEARGKVLKIVAPLIPALPQGERYRVILMDRDVDEVLDSQDHMLKRLDATGPDIERERMKQLLQHQIQRAVTLCHAHRIPILVVSHSRVLAHPAEATKEIADFLNVALDQQD